MRNYVRLSAAFLCLLFGTFAFAQTPTGAIEGTITDPSGAAVPGATVKITSPSLGTNYTLTTNSSGFYSQRNLQPGNYDITVEVSGFNTYSIKGAKVDAGAVYNGSATLQVGSTSGLRRSLQRRYRPPDRRFRYQPDRNQEPAARQP